jgi:hypothetical protein
MKQLVVIGAMALTLIAFHAGAAQAETLSVGTTAGLPQDVVQLTDQELSSIEGSGSPFGGPGGPFASGGNICVVCSNIALAINVAAGNVTGGDFTQIAVTGSQTIQ